MHSKSQLEITNDQTEVVQGLFKHHAKQLSLCQRLERIADSLPNNVDKQECLSVSWQIYPAVCEAHHFEENALFPLLSTEEEKMPNVSKSLERLKFEHWEDESSAEDISVSLRQLVFEPSQTDCEKTAYMLRGFFEGMRRHLAFEKEHLISLLL
ncbi:MAG: hemerythrin domain-containing protein [Pseudomonadota bacterium]